MKRKNKLLAILVSLVFAMLASIPWAISYYIFNKPFPILGVAIPFGAYYGYKLIEGKQSDNPMVVYVAASILASLFNCYVTAPILFVVLNSELTLDSFLHNFKWIEVTDELFNNYIWLIALVLVGVAIIYVIYIPYLLLSKKDNKDTFVETNYNSTVADPIDNINFSRPKFDFTMIKQIVISLIIVGFSVLALSIRDDTVKADEEKHIKYIENYWFNYAIPDNYSIFKEEDDEWYVMKLSSADDNSSFIMLNIHTVKEEYQTIDKLYNSLLKSNKEIPEVVNGTATLRSSPSTKVTANGYKYIELIIDNLGDAKHIVNHVIDDSFQYCVIVECVCYDNNKEILEALDQVMNTLKYD